MRPVSGCQRLGNLKWRHDPRPQWSAGSAAPKHRQVMLERLAEPAVTDRLAIGALDERYVHVAVALDHQRALVGQGEIPADDDAGGKRTMAAQGELAQRRPLRNRTAQ